MHGELRRGQARDIGGEAAGVAAVAHHGVGHAQRVDPRAREPQPELPVFGDVHLPDEPAGLRERLAAQDDAGRRHRIALVERAPQRPRLVPARRRLVPPLPGVAPIGPDDPGTAEGPTHVRSPVQRGQLRGELPGLPGVVGVAQREQVDRRVQRIQPGRPRPRRPGRRR